MTVRNVAVTGLDQLQANLDADVLLQPEMDDALATFRGRFERQGKGLGARRNSLTAETRPASVQMTSTRVWPRTVGTSWQKKNEAAAKSMGPRVVKSMIAKIEARWST